MAKRLTDEEARVAVAEWAPNFSPSVPYPGAMKSWPGVCLDCGQPIKPTYTSIKQGWRACKYCAGKAVDETVAVGKMMAKDLMPLDPYPGTMKHWLCECMKCGKKVTPTYNQIQRGFGGCWDCGHKARAVTQSTAKQGQSLKDLHPDLAAEAHGWDASTVMPRSNSKREWKCLARACGHVWESTVLNRTWGEAGCPACCEGGGYRTTKTGYFYFVAGDGWLKGGITNVPKDRLAGHRRQGLTEVLHLWEYADGSIPVELEKLWVEHIKTMPTQDRPLKDQVKDGYTESVIHTPELEAWIVEVFKPLADDLLAAPLAAA